MAINVIINSKVILLVLLALCALLITNTQATSSLSELFNKCEKKFWFKDQKDFKRFLKSKCLKEDSHYHEKRHRQHHVCNNKSHDKKLLASKWEKFSECRCESALVKLSDFKVSKVFVCYQIAHFNKATGEFLGELSVFKKKSEKDLDIAVKFSHEVKLLNYEHWRKYQKEYYRPKNDPQCSSIIGRFEVDKFYIIGRVPKCDSMNKVDVKKISPTEFMLVDKDRAKPLKNGRDAVIIPFSKFVPGKNFLTEEHEYKDKDKHKDKPSKKPANPPAEPTEKPADNPGTDNPPQDGYGDGYGDGPADNPGTDNPPQDGYGDGYGNGPADNPGTDNPPPQDGTPQDGTPQDGTPQDGTPQDGNPQDGTPQDGNPQDSTPQDGTPTGPSNPQDDTGSTDSTEPSTVSNTPTATSAGQESNANKSSNGISSAAIGSIVFGAIIAVGAAFIGYNTYERLRWRRQYRRRQAAAQQNPSLANVPDYNGYGRAY